VVDVYASEEQQVAAIKKWWKENGTSVILGIVIGTAALFGWRAWQGQITAKGEQASMAYSLLEEQLHNKKVGEAEATGKKIMKEYKSTPYASFAAFKLAKLAEDAEKTETADEYLRWIVDNGKPEDLVQLAIMRLARLNLSSGNADSAWALISSMDKSMNLATYQELKGDILLAQGKQEEARKAYLQAAALNPNPSDPVGNPFLEMKIDDLGR